MAVSYGSNTVTVGTYKSGTTTSDSTTTLNITSGEIATGDEGRLVAVIPATGNSGDVQVRRITSVSGGTISIHDPWVGTIASGTTWRVAHTLDDVHDIGNVDLEKAGRFTYRWNGDWSVASTGFLGDVDRTLEMRLTSGDSCQIASGGIVQFGILYGGEGSGVETTKGCRLYFDIRSSGIQVLGNDNSRVAEGAVVNYYGCLIESTDNGVSGWTGFQRMRGPTRFIGTMYDGIMGGRFYHEASELVQCRMSGVTNSVGSWSIGATFDRDVDDVRFYRNIGAMKSFENFSGTFRNVVYSNNGDIILRSGNSGSVFTFIDCTEFDNSDTDDNGGVLNQYRSVVIQTTDATGAALADVSFRVNDKNDTTQGSIQVSDASGDLNEVLALRRKFSHNSTTLQTFDPFRIRYRKYGYQWQSLNSPIADPIKQSTALNVNNAVTQASGTASAHTGITVTDHGGSPVSWQSKSWGITITGNLTTNSGLTASDIEHYLHYHLAQDATFNGKSSGLLWHNLAPVGKGETENGTYGTTTKGVRVVDENGDPFPGFTRMQSDDGTYYVPPVLYSITFSGLKTNSEVRIYTASTQTELAGVENSGSLFTYNYSYTADFDVDYVIFNTGFQPIRGTNLTLTNNNSTIPVSQVVDRVYSNPV